MSDKLCVHGWYSLTSKFYHVVTEWQLGNFTEEPQISILEHIFPLGPFIVFREKKNPLALYQDEESVLEILLLNVQSLFRPSLFIFSPNSWRAPLCHVNIIRTTVMSYTEAHFSFLPASSKLHCFRALIMLNPYLLQTLWHPQQWGKFKRSKGHDLL